MITIKFQRLFSKSANVANSLVVSMAFFTPLLLGANSTQRDDATSDRYEVVVPNNVEDSNDGEKIFVAVEQQPEFPGGQAALMKYLGNNIKYPDMALENGVSGRVIVKFVIEKDGSVGQVNIVKGVHHLLDHEAIRVVKSMPRWIPGKSRGLAVRCYYTMPINFRLQ